MARSIAVTWSAVAASPSSRLLVSTASTAATTTSSAPIARVPTPSHVPSPVSRVSPTPKNARIRPTSAAKSSSRMTGSSGARACRMNAVHVASPRIWLVSRIAVRNENDSSTIATSRTAIGAHFHDVIGSGWVSL